MTRCFLGFELAEESRAYLEERLVPLHAEMRQRLDWPVRLVPAANWHATLLFFHDLDPDERAVVWEEVEAAARAGVWRDLRFAWRGLALWPSPRRPNLVCLEAEPYPESLRWPLAARLDEPPFAKGEVQQLRRYVPHVTVMRFRRGRRRPRPRDWDVLQTRLPRIDPAAVRVDRVSFLLSDVPPENPVYPREHTAPLAGDPAP